MVGPGPDLECASLFIKRKPGGVKLAGAGEEIGRDPVHSPPHTHHHPVVGLRGQQFLLAIIEELQIGGPDIPGGQSDVIHLIVPGNVLLLY